MGMTGSGIKERWHGGYGGKEESARGVISGIKNALVGSQGLEGGRQTSFILGRLLFHIGICKQELAAIEPRISA